MENIIFEVNHLNLFYGEKQALMDLNMKIEKNAITALIGPSGCGKSTFLRCLNRMNDLIDGCRVEGEILIEGKDMYNGDMNVVDLRTRVGMVFILMDEPTSALDPISTNKIEELAIELKKDYTIVIVTHNMQQAARVSDYTAFFLLGEMVEFDKTSVIFQNPKDKRTEDYITGRFG